MFNRQRCGVAVLIASATAAIVGSVSLSGCGSSAKHADTSATSSTGRGQPADAATTRAVRTAYQVFFDSATAPARSAAYLQHGERFRAVLVDQSRGSYAQKSSASVSAVRLINADLAGVTFSITGGGSALLKNIPGYAVREADRWKVAAQTFCGLLRLEGDKAPACNDAAVTALPK